MKRVKRLVMKIFLYCQHVLGMGHFFRALEICNALKGHDVVLVTGGSPVEARLPDHVREIRLPPLMMDSNFKGLYSLAPGKNVDEAKADRKAFLRRVFEKECPEVLIVELYPFGRKAFRFELDPLLDDIKSGRLPPCKVVCSLRDILVEKADVIAYENRVLTTLNRYFDALLIHSDPNVLRLDDTFSKMGEISIPVHYTGFVAAMPDEAMVRHYKSIAGSDDVKIITASVGGGSVGHELLMATAQAVRLMSRSDIRMHPSDIRLDILTGPFMDEAHVTSLKRYESDTVTVERFSSDFLNRLAASNLSISMAGYNTCMNILAARVPALVWPFGQNREQRLRAELFSRNYPMVVLADEDLTPSILAEKIERQLQSSQETKAQYDTGWREAAEIDFSGAVIHSPQSHPVDLTGAATSSRLIQGLVVDGRGPG